MIRRLLVMSGAVGFCLADWLLDRFDKRLVNAQEPFRNTVDDLLMEEPTLTPWRTT